MADSNTYDYTQNYDLPYPNDANEDADLIENLEKLAEAIDVALGGKYTKPSGGIPKTDLSSEVQTSLGKADTAVQNTDYATSNTGGVFKTANGIIISSGFISNTTFSKADYDASGEKIFINKGTLDNVLTAVVGDIDTALDLINGESI